LIARTDAEAAKLITSDIDERDQPFIVGQDWTSDGFYYIKNGVDTAIARGLATQNSSSKSSPMGKRMATWPLPTRNLWEPAILIG
jgi:isocitrate lyase